MRLNIKRVFYKINATVTAETYYANYAVTIRDWSTIDSLYKNSYSTPQQKTDFTNKYSAYATEYFNAHLVSAAGDASAYALSKLFPGALNIYKAPANSTEYKPLNISVTETTVTIKTCN